MAAAKIAHNATHWLHAAVFRTSASEAKAAVNKLSAWQFPPGLLQSLATEGQHECRTAQTSTATSEYLS
jgi:hypothetical protein